MRQLAIGIAAIAALIVTPAFAADMAVKAPAAPAAAAYDPWAGFYVGASIGGRWTDVQWLTQVINDGAPNNVNNPAGLDSASVRAGGYFGYNIKIAPNWLAGSPFARRW